MIYIFGHEILGREGKMIYFSFLHQEIKIITINKMLYYYLSYYFLFEILFIKNIPKYKFNLQKLFTHTIREIKFFLHSECFFHK